MKRKLFFAAGVTVLLSAAVFASVHINNKKNVMSEFFYANVEALASGEGNTNCSFGTVIKKESSHTLICRGYGSLCCEW